MNRIRFLIVICLATILAAVVAAEEPIWIPLTGDRTHAAWRSKMADWVYTDAVTQDTTNPRKLQFEPKEGDILVNGAKGRAADLITKEKYGDVEVHAEFLIPKGSNSGIKLMAVYEIQIYDSHGVKELSGNDCGGVYPRAEQKPAYHHIDKGIAPKVNAAKPAGEWQTIDIVFRAAKFDTEGKKTNHARFDKVVLNGQIIHENQVIETPTGNNHSKPEAATGPILFQGDHGPVSFRNVKVRAINVK